MRAHTPNGERAALLPPVITWIMFLCLAFGAGLLLRLSLHPPRLAVVNPVGQASGPLRARQSAAALAPSLEQEATTMAGQAGDAGQQTGKTSMAPHAPPPALGWPACVPDVRGRIESMAGADAMLRKQRLTLTRRAAAWQKAAANATRRALQAEGSAAGGAQAQGDSRSSSARQRDRTKPTSLLAVATANVWPKTELMLQSLTANRDAFEVMFVDELSTDPTPKLLREYGIWMAVPPKRLGVTYNWNLAYRLWLQTEHEYLFFVNNDVLVPDGVIDALARAMTAEGGDCDLVTPQSTVRGKGYWGDVEGFEALLNLSRAGDTFVNRPLNYRRVQAALTEAGCVGESAVLEEKEVHTKKPGFSGFFFGVRRGIAHWAHDEDNLFDPANRLFKQESDLYTRTQDPSRDRQAKLCMHMGTFVWHWKGGTIPMGGDRTKWEIPSERTNAKAKASIKHK